MHPVAVLGAGAWGTALAIAIARTARPVVLWGRDVAAMTRIDQVRENASRLPGARLPPSLVVTSDLACALDGADILVLAVPAQTLRPLAREIAGASSSAGLVICAKGIERGTAAFLTDVIAEEMPGRKTAVLSGPSFAADVGNDLPTAVTIAAPTLREAANLADALGSPRLRLYRSDDVRGVEIGGAAKNVLAIACGIAAGRGLGASAVAALTARAFAELARFGHACGGRPETLAGLSGLGDLVLTCGSTQSRNFSHGFRLGRGHHEIVGETSPLVEGMWTAPALVHLAAARGVDMPICDAVAAVLAGTLSVDRAIERLMQRPMRSEI